MPRGMPRDSTVAWSAFAFSAASTNVMAYWPVMFVSVWLTMCCFSAGIFNFGYHVFGLTKDVFEFGRLALALLEVTAENDLLAVLSFVIEWRRGDRCGEHANKREWENVNHFDRKTKYVWK